MRIAIPKELEEYIRIRDEEIIEKKEIPEELKKEVQAFKEEYAFELYKTKGKVSESIKGKIVNDLIRKVQEMPYDTQFTIRELTNEFVEGKELMDISSRFFSKIKKTSIKLQCTCGENEIVGLPYNIPYIKKLDLDSIMDNFLDNNSQIDSDDEFNKYCKLYEEKFGKHAYILEPGGTKEKTIEAIKICLERNEDILDKLLNPNDDQDFLL